MDVFMKRVLRQDFVGELAWIMVEFCSGQTFTSSSTRGCSSIILLALSVFSEQGSVFRRSNGDTPTKRLVQWNCLANRFTLLLVQQWPGVEGEVHNLPTTL
jgi:hypothetical protein